MKKMKKIQNLIKKNQKNQNYLIKKKILILVVNIKSQKKIQLI